MKGLSVYVSLILIDHLILVADEWPSSLQVILDVMNFTSHEKVSCASFVLKKDGRYDGKK